MDHFLTLSENTDNFSSKININKYTEGENCLQKDVLKTNNILEIILSLKDYNYQILENSEKKNYIKKKTLELATFLDCNYDNYNYNKRKFNKDLVCKNLQMENYLSSILFFNDYYKINIVICNNVQNIIRYFKTGIKNFENIYIIYDDGKFSHFQEETSIVNCVFDGIDGEMGPVDDPFYILSKVIKYDIKPDNFIYNTFLKNITTYKVTELIQIANENNINIKGLDSKKKTKKMLYDDINFSKI